MHIDARQYFQEIARAIQRFYQLEERRAKAVKRSLNKRVRGGITCSPTERLAMFALCEIAQINEQEQRLWSFVDEGLEVLDCVKVVLGDKYAEALYCRYFINWPIRIAAAAHGISLRAEKYRLQIALDWLDSTPDAYIKDKRGIA